MQCFGPCRGVGNKRGPTWRFVLTGSGRRAEREQNLHASGDPQLAEGRSRMNKAQLLRAVDPKKR